MSNINADALAIRARDHIKRANSTMKGLKSTNIEEVFAAMREPLAKALMNRIDPDHMIQVATELVARNPKIAECSAQSILGAVVQCSLLGLRPILQLGHVYIVPYKGQAQLQIGYRGWVALAYRSDRVLFIEAHPVFEGDDFEFCYGLEKTLVHRPQFKTRKLLYAYAVVRLKGGGSLFHVLTHAEIEALRMRNAMQESTPSGAWATDYPDMACAKAVKKLIRYVPSEEFQKAERIDESITDIEKGVDFGDVTYPVEEEGVAMEYEEANVVDPQDPLGLKEAGDE